MTHYIARPAPIGWGFCAGALVPELPGRGPADGEAAVSGRASRTARGLLLTRARLGDIVDEVGNLCSIVNIYGDEVETITAPARGVFVRSTTLSTVSRGERAATLGLL